MSNLFKSKFLLGLVVALAVVVTFGTTANAAITSTLKQGMSNSQVMELQQNLNGAGFTVSTTGAGSVGMETSYFGIKTKTAVMAYQQNKGLVVDGIFGPASRAAWTGGAISGNFPAGCTSASGFSPLTGVPCNSVNANTFPAGCTSASGFSPLTGTKCDSSGSTTTPQTGPVSAMLASDNPASGTLVAGQATADLAHFAFSGSGTVTAVTLQRIGVSADSTPSNVYLFDGATRLTDAASVANNGTVTFNVPAGIFTVAGSKTISVKSDVAASTSGQTLGFMLATFTTSEGTVTANLSGNIHTIASATLASVSGGTETPDGATLNPGPNVTVWQNTLSISQRDVWMKRLALRNVGSAPAASFQNLKLFVNGVQVATATGLDINGYVTFDMASAPVLLVSGSRVVRVDADIVSGASRTVNFSLRQAADVDFVDSSFGVNIAPTSTPWAPTNASTISGSTGGSLTIEKDVTSPSTNLVNQGSDVNLGTFKFTAYGEPIKVETLRATYASSDSAIGSLRNGRILIGGVQYGSTATLNEDSQGTPYTSYTVNYTFTPGVPVMVEIHSDIYDNDGTDSITAGTDTLAAAFAVGSSNAVRQDSLGTFNAPATAVSANTLTVGSTTATLTKNSTYANQSVAVPSTGFKIGSWNLAGSSTEDVLMNTLSFDVDEVLNATFNESDITNLAVVVKDSSGNVLSNPTPLATATATDNNFSVNFTLAKNANVTIELSANLGSTVTILDSFKTDLTATGTALVSGTAVDASSGNIDGQTIAAATASITVSKDASSPVTGIVYDNQLVTTLDAKFTAVTAGYNITDLTVTLGNANAATIVQSVQLYDGSTFIKSVPMATTTTAVFSGISVNVPANTNKVLTVKLQLGTIGVGAAETTGPTLTTSIAAATDVVYTNTSTGVSTSSTSEEGTSVATGSTMYAYASIPTVTKKDLTGSELDLLAGTKVLARFDVSSNGGTVAWKEVMFDITKIAAPTISSVALWDVTGGSNTEITSVKAFQNGTAGVATTCVADNTFCELMITVGAKSDDNVEEQVSGTKTYEVRATIGGTLATGNSVSTSLTSNLAHVSAAVFTTNDNDTTVNDATFVWSDISAQNHDTGTADWVNENLVKVLPTSTWTLTYPI